MSWLVSVLLGCLLVKASFTSDPIQTGRGLVIGSLSTYNDQSLRTYLGIPYAKPPVGDLRFQPPVEPEPWTLTLMATEYSDTCHQIEPTMGFGTFPESEDCLYLNVFVPVTNESERLAVMVWIHGGALNSGSVRDVLPEALALQGQVIVVTVAYRLNVFGFFTTGSDIAEGNVGMLDQVMALRWVTDNIGAFGGDVDRITLFGQSAGSWSATAHLVSPLSAGLFNRVIGQSGSIQSFHYKTGKEMMESSKMLGEGVGCPTEDERAMVKCLQNKPAGSLFAEAKAIEYSSPLGPLTVGGRFLPHQPRDMWKKYKPSADLMIGMNSDEAFVFVQSLPPVFGEDVLDTVLMEGLSIDSPMFTFLLGPVLAFVSEKLPPRTLRDLMISQFFGDINPIEKLKILRRVVDTAAGRFFVSPILLTANSTSSAGKEVYMYYFSEVTETAALAEYIPLFQPRIRISDFSTGAAHSTELPYTFGLMSMPDVPMSLYSLAQVVDRNLSRSMMHAWTSFAKTGKPVFLLSNGTKTDWPKYTTESKEYVEFNASMTPKSIKSNLLPKVNTFWNVFFTALEEKYQSLGQSFSCPGTIDSDDKADKASLIPPEQAETVMFLLIAVLVVMFVVTLMTICCHCNANRELKKLRKEGIEKI